MKRSLSVFTAVTFFYLIAGPLDAHGEKRAEVPRGAFVASGTGDARILIPFLADDSASAMICDKIYSGLTKVGRDLDIEGDLAESWVVSDDGKKITFKLRKNVLWHDGKNFTSSDVKFTYETLLKPATGSPYIASYSDIDRIEVIDDHTISFNYSRPYSPALSKFGMGIIPLHLLSGVDNIRESGLARSPVGTGPYMFSSWESGQFIILDAFPGYFRDGPYIKRYVYKIIPDSAVQYLELISGGIDSMTLDPYQYIYRSDEKVFNSRVNKYRYLSRSYTYIGYNLNDPVLSDRDVRAALSYAVDKRKLIDSVLLGLGEKCTGPFFKRSPFYNDDVEGYPYDPDKAKRLLRNAGWTDADNDGILEKEGEEFRIGLSTNQGNRTRKDAATIIQSHWAKIGVKADIQVVSWSAFLDQFVNRKNFQAVILGWTLPLDPDLYNVWHSRASGTGGLNFVSFRNRELDRLIEEGRTEFDISRRAEIYRKAHRIISEAAPYTFLYFPYALPAVHKRFRGIEPAAAGIGYNFTEWYVPADEVVYDFRRDGDK